MTSKGVERGRQSQEMLVDRFVYLAPLAYGKIKKTALRNLYRPRLEGGLWKNKWLQCV